PNAVLAMWMANYYGMSMKSLITASNIALDAYGSAYDPTTNHSHELDALRMVVFETASVAPGVYNLAMEHAIWNDLASGIPAVNGVPLFQYPTGMCYDYTVTSCRTGQAPEYPGQEDLQQQDDSGNLYDGSFWAYTDTFTEATINGVETPFPMCYAC